MERLYNRRSKRLRYKCPCASTDRYGCEARFREEVRTLSISAHGSLVPLATSVELGQVLVVMNRMTGEEQECRVAYVGPAAEGKAKVGLAFRHPAPHFWQVDFPQVRPAGHPVAQQHHAHAVAAHRTSRR